MVGDDNGQDETELKQRCYSQENGSLERECF